jgi:hydroxymethylglutaryl-CoA reductase
MALNPELFNGFSKCNYQARLARLVKMGALTADDCVQLTARKTLQPELAEKFIENVIGYFQLPLGVAANFCIDGIDRVIPMAVEETSIIAALSKTAKWCRSQGSIKTEIIGDTIIGQIQIAKVNDLAKLTQMIAEQKADLIEQANQKVVPGLLKRGGGVRDMSVRHIDRGDGHTMAVIHVTMDPKDAMGANMIIQVCEYLKDPIQALTGETVTMCILSNLSDTKITKATVTINQVEPTLAKKIEEASIFAELDPYRASTHNKGILNGIDPVLIATGNDWRAVEAAAHAYAARNGQYTALSRWRANGDTLTGEFAAPIAVGTVGGVTRLHPMAQLSLRMLAVDSANDLARITAAVGLVQNLGALRALITLGFTEGHMKLHISNLTLSAGANGQEIPLLQDRLEVLLKNQKRLTLTHAVDLLKEIRHEMQSHAVT